MKKFFLLSCVILSSAFGLNAWENVDCSIEARVSGFLPTSSRVREIYKRGWAVYELQVSQTYCNVWTPWIGGSWMTELNGRSRCFHNKTRLRLDGVRFGLQTQYCLTSCLQFYLGGGLIYNFLRIHDKSRFVKQHISKNALGSIAQIGLYYDFYKCFFLDLNFEYLYQRFNFSRDRRFRHVRRNDLNLNGFKIGAGLGVTF